MQTQGKEIARVNLKKDSGGKRLSKQNKRRQAKRHRLKDGKMAPSGLALDIANKRNRKSVSRKKCRKVYCFIFFS